MNTRILDLGPRPEIRGNPGNMLGNVGSLCLRGLLGPAIGSKPLAIWSWTQENEGPCRRLLQEDDSVETVDLRPPKEQVSSCQRRSCAIPQFWKLNKGFKQRPDLWALHYFG